MDMNLLAALPDDLKEKYNQLMAVLNAPGWKAVLSDLEEQYASSQAVLANANSWDEYQYSRGYRDALLQVLELETRIDRDFTSFAEEQAVEEEVAVVTSEQALGDFL